MGRSGRVAAIVVGAALVAGLAACDPRTPPPGRLTDTVTATPRATTSTTAAVRRLTSTTVVRKPSPGGGGSRPKPTTTTTSTSTSTSTVPPTTTSVPPTTTSTTAAPAPSGLLWRSSYDGAAAPGDVWQSEQEAADDRLQLVDGYHGRVLRAELHVGDVVSGGNRAEVYGRHASPRETPADQWPDPVGATRWYGFDLYVPNDFVTDPTGLAWFSFTQWKGRDGGQPAIALEIKRDRLEMAGASGRDDLGPLKRGQWERIVVGVHIDPTSAGWVEVHRDGAVALPRTNRPTTTYVNGQPDPIYLKQGIYRSSTWTVTHVLELGPMSIGLSKTDVD